MATKIGIYPSLLRQAGGKTSDIHDRIINVLTALEASIAGRGEPWGDDKIGHQFTQGDNGYLASQEGSTKSGRSMAASFDSFSTSQYRAADTLERTDRNNPFGKP
ncbi:hypothetical protein D5S18_23165 [Nocardia panacis]|uniref:WXG100 family type VII secretion target n=1 Tax=Nocardia panacis TaxID=2340916 RepID=A0A3A4KDH2_9NOCA|nr:hypothetical protein [Nocardia panacis]RJO72082.1 hypothetical protein D5S18_23165 [Nocardia panacis]